ncbi:MAG TPA: aldo/keto reductase [Anaerolineales bacterium]|nr:aldo/keto reductase [Anaerolineales bacterium]
MNYRRMGRWGLKLSEISLGAWLTFGDDVDEKSAERMLHLAYDQGVNFFDNADVYQSGRAEEVMGAAMRGLPRTALVVSSKAFWRTMAGPNGQGLSRKHILESCHASLRRLGTDYLDLYFCHRFDRETPLDETVRVMDDLVRQGKVLYWGTSEWTAEQIEQAIDIARQAGQTAPAVEQPQYNLLVRRVVEQTLAPLADRTGIGLVTWSPLRSGLLSGKYNGPKASQARLTRPKYDWLGDILTEANLAVARGLADVAGDLGCTPAQLAIGWLLRTSQVTSVITGATSEAQLQENLGAGEVPPRLTPEVLSRIEGLLAGGAV